MSVSCLWESDDRSRGTGSDTIGPTWEARILPLEVPLFIPKDEGKEFVQPGGPNDPQSRFAIAPLIPNLGLRV